MYLWNHWFSKIPPKNLIDFSPARFNISKYLVYKIFLGWNLSNFSVVFWKINDFVKDILRLSDLYKSSFYMLKVISWFSRPHYDVKNISIKKESLRWYIGKRGQEIGLHSTEVCFCSCKFFASMSAFKNPSSCYRVSTFQTLWFVDFPCDFVQDISIWQKSDFDQTFIINKLEDFQALQA